MVMGAFFNRLLVSRLRPGFIIRRLGLSTRATPVVCRSSPWLMLPSTAVTEPYASDVGVRSMDYSFYRLSDKQTISLRNKGNSYFPKIVPDPLCFGSSSGWLLYCDPRSYSLKLVNPLCPKPPMVPLPGLVNIFDDDDVDDVVAGEIDDKLVIDKFSLSGFIDEDSYDLVIVIIVQKQLKFWSAVTGSRNWVKLDHNSVPMIDVIYSSKDQLYYTLDSNYEVQTWDLRKDHNGEIIPKHKAYHPTIIINHHHHHDHDQGLCSKYLVESKGDILLVIRYYCSKNNNNNNIDPPISKTRRFDIYKLNEAKDSWEQLKSLGDRVLFLGMNEPFSHSSSDFPELKPNSVYFTGPAANEGKYSASDWGIYDLNDHTVTCHYPCDYTLKIRPPPIWIGPLNSPPISPTHRL